MNEINCAVQIAKRNNNKNDAIDVRYSAKVDMHNHTTGSDGDDSPLMLMFRSHRLGLKTISITDHNSLEGYTRLREQINELTEKYERIVENPEMSDIRKKQARMGARKLYSIITDVTVVTGCELLSFYMGCPYVEVLAYNIDLSILDKKIKEMREGLSEPGEIIAQGLKALVQSHNIRIDGYFIDNRNDYRKLFFHELIRHTENAPLVEGIEGFTEAEKATIFAMKYLDNDQSDYYVNLNNPGTRKKNLIRMIQQHRELVFDTAIIRYAGSAAGQFYVEFMKYPENKYLLDARITSLKSFLYYGIYNRDSLFYIDLSTTKPPLQAVIDSIHNAGGVALIAHWGRYKKSNPGIFDWNTPEGKTNLEDMIDMCDGAECFYPDNPYDLRRTIRDLCREKGKLLSIGSDYHGRNNKEGSQYKLGSQNGINLEEMQWIIDAVRDGNEYLRLLEEKYHFKKRLQAVMQRI